ncbi:MAG TPA: peptidyl-prolyl cis-trans isomerase [Acidobacteriota bacterium]
MRRAQKLGLAAAVLAAWSGGCERTREADVVATYRGGVVRLGELDRLVRELPASQRQPPDGDWAGWHQRAVRDLVVRRLLVEEARGRGLHLEPAYRGARDEARRQWIVNAYLNRELERLGPVSEAELRAEFERRRSDYDRPERRYVRHLFKRWRSDRDREALLAEMRELRHRAESGEPFTILAARHSESETRGREGLIGWVARGWLKSEVDAVIFRLRESEISQPIRTAEGVHLVTVERILPPRSFGFEEVRQQLLDRLRGVRRARLIRELSSAEAAPENAVVPAPERIGELVQSGRPSDVVLRIGDYALTVQRLRALMQSEALRAGAPSGAPLAQRIVESIRVRELLYRRCRAEGELPAAVERGFERGEDKALFGFFLSIRIAEYLDQHPELIRRHYEDHRSRFDAPLRFRIERLVARQPSDPNRVMAELAGLTERAGAAEGAMAAAARRLGASREDLGWHTLAEYAAIDLRLPSLLAPLKAGQFAAPFQQGGSIQLWRVVAREEPKPREFAAARADVRTDLATTQAQELYERIARELLAKVQLEIDTESLSQIPPEPLLPSAAGTNGIGK